MVSHETDDGGRGVPRTLHLTVSRYETWLDHGGIERESGRHREQTIQPPA